ncbi:hypothetical protein SERLA73DRAFT_159711 [Serpula lacrymans var. lacrymans S7.3]|uniref:Uncharacterized protein n=2 Tax=Serpula lacrymans var. lacrymans TaxID=341189 RepID=F8PS60_SERL3|nr:uncharacterized protein SERLADRAFT_414739 [Serpula lacrymans var. lacrymans S7.9]EGO01242.1 hypothetical protein SERLA73DRAFT_159711 [Serpula lacrymans var. lacrymans S7.3]EGO26890.1 hypothetical protein SERLADRAFT_414739 [Serpula lacrymans var. lacrymans S7.9]
MVPDETQSDVPLLDGITIHHFTRESDVSLSSPTSLVEHGRALVNAACYSNGWVNTNASFGEYDFDLSDRKLFTVALDPPTLSSEEQGRLGSWARDLKDWGASPGVTDWDYFTLDDLSSFESTDFEYLSVYFHSYDRKRPGKINRHESEIQDPEPLTDDARTSRRRARSLSQETSPNVLVRPSKRTRYDISPLFTAIPQPHFYSARFTDCLPKTALRVKPYAKTGKVPFPPYDSKSVQEYLDTPYARGAWLIPVRGIPPWDDATVAIILDPLPGEDILLPSGPVSGVANNSQIAWTHPALLAFWNFLISLREANTLGPISLSFHAAPSNTSFFTGSDTHTTNSLSYPNRPPSLKSPGGSSTVPGYPCRTPLDRVDHIKVYHDVCYTMIIRNVLDAFQYIMEPERYDGGSNGKSVNRKPSQQETELTTPEVVEKTQKIRMLKGAKLVFVNDRAQGVFLS